MKPKPNTKDMQKPIHPVFAGKRVLIDGQNLALARGTGIATYSKQIIAGQRSLGFNVDAVIASRFAPRAGGARVNRVKFDNGDAGSSLVNAKQRSFLRGLLASPFGISLADVDKSPPHLIDSELGRLPMVDRVLTGRDLFDLARQHAIRWGQMLPLKLDEALKPDLFHAMQIAPMRVAGRPSVVTIHDIIPLVMPNSTTENLRHFRTVVDTILRKADHIITVSEHSRRDLLQIMKGDERRITNTFQTVEIPQKLVERSINEIDSDLAFYGLEQNEYFMYLGAIEPKKNVKRLVEAFAGSGTKKTLVIVGGLGWNYHDDLSAINDDRFVVYRRYGNLLRKERQVRRLSYVPQPQLISLLRGTRGLLFPSLYEGFGLPVAEALALSTPVVTSNTSSLVEIAGEAAIQVDPLDLIAMAKAIRTLDQDGDLRAELSRRGPEQVAQFSAENHRKRLEAVYRQIL
jgi:glycosyltransferase involved in cell wall biosynthesis